MWFLLVPTQSQLHSCSVGSAQRHVSWGGARRRWSRLYQLSIKNPQLEESCQTSRCLRAIRVREIDKLRLRLSGWIRRAARSRNNAFCVSDSWRRLITSLGAWQRSSPHCWFIPGFTTHKQDKLSVQGWSQCQWAKMMGMLSHAEQDTGDVLITSSHLPDLSWI